MMSYVKLLFYCIFKFWPHYVGFLFFLLSVIIFCYYMYIIYNYMHNIYFYSFFSLRTTRVFFIFRVIIFLFIFVFFFLFFRLRGFFICLTPLNLNNFSFFFIFLFLGFIFLYKNLIFFFKLNFLILHFFLVNFSFNYNNFLNYIDFSCKKFKFNFVFNYKNHIYYFLKYFLDLLLFILFFVDFFFYDRILVHTTFFLPYYGLYKFIFIILDFFLNSLEYVFDVVISDILYSDHEYLLYDFQNKFVFENSLYDKKKVKIFKSLKGYLFNDLLRVKVTENEY